MLYTRCPNCQTTFRVTADTLRVASGAVRCGNCATVYSAFSGMRQDALDPGMQSDEDFLSPTLQTQELASIQEIAAPELAEPSPADAADDAANDERTAATTEPVTPTRTGPAAAPPSPAPATELEPEEPPGGDAPEELDFEDATPGEPVRAAPADDEPGILHIEVSDDEPDAPHAGATSGALQFEVPADDDWAQLLKEIEDSTSEAVPTEATPGEREERHETQSDDSAVVDLGEADERSNLWDVGEPFSLEHWEETTSRSGNDESHRIAASAGSPMTGQTSAIAAEDAYDAENDAEPMTTEELISAEQIDATLSAEPDPDIMAALEAGLGAPPAVAKNARLWRTGAVLMGLLLAGQLVHHNRTLLATQPVVGPLVQHGYALFGTALAPDWDLDQYEITNWAATAGETDSGIGNLRITAQIRNGGPAAQPYPSIQLELKDRWETVIGSRVFSPREYLGTDFDTDALMGSGTSVPAQLAVVDPGLDASGFELDVCLASGGNSYRCAADRVFE